MAETSLGRLQKQVDTLSKKIVRLQDNLEYQKEEKRKIQHQYNKLKNEVEDIVNKAVNKAVDAVKKEYEEIIKQKDQRIFELECRLNINSDTSSLPSSKNPLDKPKTEIQNSREKTDRSKGGQKNHPKHKLEKFKDEEVTEVIKHIPKICPHCNSNNLTIIDIAQRDVLDFEIIVKKQRNEFATCKCNECGTVIKEKVPESMHAENQYGKNVKSFIISLYNYGFVSYNRCRNLIYGLTNGEINPSEGYMVKIQKKAGIKLENFVFDVTEKLKHSKLLHWDDTVVRIGEKEKACFRAYTDKAFVLFKAHMAKNTEGMNEDGILQNLTSNTVVMHDHLLHNYCDEYNYQNAECNAHITRKLKGITVNTKHKWSDDMEKLLLTTLAKRNDYISKNVMSFSSEELKNILSEYDKIVKAGFSEYKEFKHKYEFEKEENLLEFFRDYKDNITFWMRDFSVPYSNNIVESLLRMIKAKMKISMQFQTLEHARYFANIRSYVETCGNFGISKTVALNRLFDSEPYSVQELLQLKNS